MAIEAVADAAARVRAADRLAGPLRDCRIFMLLLNAPFYGSERLMVQTAHVLREQGAEVLVATCDWEFGGIRRELARRGVAYVDILMRGMFTRRGGVRRVARVVFEALRSSWRVRAAAHRFRPTHILIPDESNFLYALPLLLTPGRARAIFVPANVPDDGQAQRSAAYRFYLTRVIGGLVDSVVANSAFTATRLRRWMPARTNITPIPCCLPAREQPGADAALDAVNPDRFNIVYIGQLAAHKGVDLLVDAALSLATRYAHVDVVLAGPGDDRSADEQQWRARVVSAGLSERIRFIGPVRDVPRLLSMAALHVMPSRCEESFGLVVLEAKHAGVPSVVFPAGALPELVHDGVDGLVCRESSASALLEALEQFIVSPPVRDRAAREARASADTYSVERFAERWVRLLTRAETH